MLVRLQDLGQVEGNRVSVVGDLGLGGRGEDSWSHDTLPGALLHDTALPGQPWTRDEQPSSACCPSPKGSHAHAAGQRGCLATAGEKLRQGVEGEHKEESKIACQ